MQIQRNHPTPLTDARQEGARTAGSYTFSDRELDLLRGALEVRELELMRLGLLHLYPGLQELRARMEKDPQPAGREPGGRG